MNLYFLSTLVESHFKKSIEPISKNITYITRPSKLSDVSELKEDDEKIIVIDPDFVEWEVTRSDLESIKNLKAVLVSSTSFSWVDQSFLNENNIPLINVKDWCTQAVAEYATTMALNLARKIPLLIQNNFELDYAKYCGVELKNKTAGIIGIGNIGNAIAEKAKGLGMNIIYWSKNSKTDIAKYIELEDLFKTSDFIFPTMADNSETKKIITDEFIKSMKQSSYFISIVHRYYNHNLLIEMTKENKISGYGFEDNELKMKDLNGNIWVAPEYAWCTKESFQTNDRKLLENIKMALSGNYSNRVN